jgi:uncharacterized protein (TIGR01244 family)
MFARFAQSMLTLLAAVAVVSVLTAQSQVTKDAVPGVTNFARVETTVACGGATTPEALPHLKKMGFKSVVNLRVATEPGADIPAEEAAAKTAGLNFVHIPYAVNAPDPALVDRFLAAVTASGNQPAYIHCAGGSRAAGLWLIKRVMVDKWDVDRAVTEAEALGLSSAPVKKFALGYIESHKK